MLVFWNENLVYLAVPKTGSTALEAALDPRASLSFRRPPNIKHSHAYRFHTFTRPMLDRSAKKNWQLVAVIRDPVDWLGSWYRYLQRDGMQGDPRYTGGMSFERFVLDHLNATPPVHADVGRQSFMVRSDDGRLLVQRLFAYEQQDALIDFFEARLKTRLKIARKNVSPAKELSLSDKTLDRLRIEKHVEFTLHDTAKEAGAAGGIIR